MEDYGSVEKGTLESVLRSQGKHFRVKQPDK